MLYGSTNIVEKLTDEYVDNNVTKYGTLKDVKLYSTFQYEVEMYGVIKLRYCNQVCFARILGFNEKNEFVYDNELLLLDKDEVNQCFAPVYDKPKRSFLKWLVKK